MPLLAFATLACAALFFYVSYSCGMMRGKHKVAPGSVDGPEEFKLYYRSQANLLESLMMFLPSVWIFGVFGSATVAGVLSLVYLGGRVTYHRAYVSDPAARTIPFMIGIASTAIAWVGALVSVGIDALT